MKHIKNYDTNIYFYGKWNNMLYTIPWNPSSEASFTTAFLKLFKADGWWAYKIPDVGFWAKPFDFFWLCDLGVIFCEAKYIKNTTFNFNMFQPSQLKSLRVLTNLAKKYDLEEFVHPVVLVYSSEVKKYKFIRYSEILKILDNPNKENKIILDFDKCYFPK